MKEIEDLNPVVTPVVRDAWTDAVDEHHAQCVRYWERIRQHDPARYRTMTFHDVRLHLPPEMRGLPWGSPVPVKPSS